VKLRFCGRMPRENAVWILVIITLCLLPYNTAIEIGFSFLQWLWYWQRLEYLIIAMMLLGVRRWDRRFRPVFSSLSYCSHRVPLSISGRSVGTAWSWYLLGLNYQVFRFRGCLLMSLMRSPKTLSMLTMMRFWGSLLLSSNFNYFSYSRLFLD
jgi:hypothetical protein